MCALFGWLDYKHKIQHKVLKKLTQALANAAEERGTDASGISYISNGKVKIYKRPKPAHKVRFSFPVGTSAVMGHTRMTTQGDEMHNYNNHPFEGHGDKYFAFAHNGVLYNDKVLRDKMGLPETHIETDSYVAVQLIEKYGKLNFDSLKLMAEEVSGSFTFTALDEHNKLYFVKGSNPIRIICIESLGLYIYASTNTILSEALSKLGLKLKHFTEVPVDEGELMSINCNGRIERSNFDYCDIDYFRYPYYRGSRYMTEDEQELWLLETCNSFGVDEDTVLMLLEFGYTADEIEEMFMDDDLLQRCLSDINEIDIFEEAYELPI